MDADATYQPTLSELTEVAIKKLSQNENGYFVFIEGGFFPNKQVLHKNLLGI